MGKIVKFIDPSKLDPQRNAILNTLKDARKAVKRGQVRGIAMIIVSGTNNHLGSFWMTEEGGVFSLLAGADYLKQQIWHTIHSSQEG